MLAGNGLIRLREISSSVRLFIQNINSLNSMDRLSKLYEYHQRSAESNSSDWFYWSNNSWWCYWQKALFRESLLRLAPADMQYLAAPHGCLGVRLHFTNLCNHALFRCLPMITSLIWYFPATLAVPAMVHSRHAESLILWDGRHFAYIDWLFVLSYIVFIFHRAWAAI